MISLRLCFVRTVVEAVIAILSVIDTVLTAVIAAKRWISRVFCGALETPRQGRRVVIVGGSFAGLRVQRDLCEKGGFDVTVVDPKEYFEYTPGVLRLYTNPALLRSMTAPLPTRQSSLAVGMVTAMTDAEVILNDGRRLPYDYAVIACGAGYPCGPVRPTADERTLAQRQATWDNAAAALAASRSVIIAGGGIVAVELAAEIITVHGGKKNITLVTSGEHLCSSLAPRVGAACRKWLECRGVTILPNSPVDAVDSVAGAVTLRGGQTMEAGVVYDCRGNGPSNAAQFMAEAADKREVDGKGRVTVDPTLVVQGSSGRVFGAGDAMLMPNYSSDPKLGHTAELNADIVAHNIRHLATHPQEEQEEELETYPFGAVGADTPPRVYCVSLGEADGILIFNGLVVEGLLAALVKPLLEWTNVAACAERPIGVGFWKLSDAAANFLSRHVIKPTAPSSTDKRTLA